MAGKKRKAKSTLKAPAPKRRTLAEKLADPIWRTESEKSPLVHENLHARYADPKTYANWTKEDWEAARRECLPEDAPYNEDGYSVPITYFKYDQDWRRCVREFQEDLGAGRMDPEWQRQALQAMEERARGDFDKFKNDEFEEFWGQKQKTNSRELAGESAQIKLEELLRHKVLRIGDIISYDRVFGKGKDRIMVEKDVKVLVVDEDSLTVAVPPGQLKYARFLPTPETTPKKEDSSTARIHKNASEPSLKDAKDGQSLGSIGPAAYDRTPSSPEQAPSAKIEGVGDNSISPSAMEDGSLEPNAAISGVQRLSEDKRLLADCDMHDSRDSNLAVEPAPGEDQEARKSGLSLSRPVDDLQKTPIAIRNPELAINSHPTLESTEPDQKLTKDESGKNSDQDARSGLMEDVILVQVKTLTELERRIVEIDGKVPMTGYRSSNSWKAMRGKRNNQDMGSLFDMREVFYVHTSPTIVKEPKRTRGGREVKERKA